MFWVSLVVSCSNTRYYSVLSHNVGLTSAARTLHKLACGEVRCTDVNGHSICESEYGLRKINIVIEHGKNPIDHRKL